MAEQLKLRFGKPFIKDLSTCFVTVYSKFDTKKFTKFVFDKSWDDLELKERMRHITLGLNTVLPSDYPKAIKIMKKVKKIYKVVDFEMIVFPDYVEVYGQDHWDVSVDAMEDFTEMATAEFAVRPYIKLNSKKMMKTMTKWSKHKNYHVRRLATEGCRPRLPWAMALPEFKKDPSLVIPILETLKNDPELYVRRSVANNLNDIAKDNPQVVVKLLKKWNKDKSAEMQWLIRHALRSLEKQGDPGTLAILGFSTKTNINIEKFKLSRSTIKMGESFGLDLQLSTTQVKEQSLLIDYVIYHVKANGTLKPKIFKWTKKKIQKSSPLKLTKKHSIREISTRKYYAGKHEVHIQINGQIVAKKKFDLEMS
jgi:3-methyladenine DNA glycosylase AlkC